MRMWPIKLLLSAIILLGMQFVSGPPQPGTVAGRIEIKVTPPQQVVSRYPTPGGVVQGSVAPIPTVVFIDGPVNGAPVWPKPSRAAIVQKNLQFSPAMLAIPRDTSVSFPNQDSEFHNVFSYSKSKRFDLGRYPKGESKSVLFDKPGIVKIYCEVHPWMRAAVLVLENPFYALVSEDGTFSIQGIPAGHYDLMVWNIDFGSKRVGVDVLAGKSSELLVPLSGMFESDAAIQDMSLNALAAKTANPAVVLPKRACCAGKR
jgi:hypothetical protein